MTGLVPLPGARTAAVALGVLSAVVAVAGGDMGAAVLRGGAVLALLAAGHHAIRRMRARAPGQAPPTLVVAERCALGREVGVALVRVGARRLVVGWAPSGVSLLADLGGAAEGGR